jgi:hypothetical protein
LLYQLSSRREASRTQETVVKRTANKASKKLSLRKQTLRTLSAKELSDAQGGFLLRLGGDTDLCDTTYDTGSAACSSLNFGG